VHAQVGELGPVVLQVELETLGQLLRNRVDRAPDRVGHHARIEVAKLAAFLERAHELLEVDRRRVDRRGVEWKTAVAAAGPAVDLDDGDHVVAGLIHEGEVRLDVRVERARARRLRLDPRADVLTASPEHLGDYRPEEVLLAGEVVSEDALARSGSLRDAGQRCLAIAELGDRVDRRGGNLRPPCGGDERWLILVLGPSRTIFGPREWIGVLVVAIFLIVMGLTVLSGGSSLPLKLRNAGFAGVLGLICVVSVLVRRPLPILPLQIRARRDRELADGLERMSHNKPLLRTLAVITALVGITLLVSAAVQTILALTLFDHRVRRQHPRGQVDHLCRGRGSDRVVPPPSPVAARSRPRRRAWWTARPTTPPAGAL
jgi:hypothetical protein